MKEKADAIHMPFLTQLSRHGDQVIVVNPNHVIRSDDVRQFAGDMAVHSKIACKVATRELREIDAIMQNGPQHAVCKTVVIFLVVFMR